MRKVDPSVLPRLYQGNQATAREFVAAITPIFQRAAGAALYLRGRREGRDIRQELEDMVHDLFVALCEDDYRRLRTWKPDGGRSLESYLFQFAQFQVASVLRVRRKNPYTQRPTEPDELTRAQGAAPQGDAADREVVEKLLERLGAEMEPEDLALFRAFFVEEADVAEIARRFGLTPPTVYKRKSRLLARLREMLSELLG
jgi:RNA polymerase sigma factor (sigma-70 family)